MLSFVGCTALLGAAVNEVSKERTVTYSVEGKGSARISFWANGGMSSADNAKLPWSQKVTAPGYQFGSVTVTLDHNGGTVTCRITGEDGKVISENTGSGAFGTANCNGTANG